MEEQFSFENTEDWGAHREWRELRRKLQDFLGRTSPPDLNAVLFLIGIQEWGQVRDHYEKEEKVHLMDIAVCKLLSLDGHYRFLGRDEEYWPKWELIDPIEFQSEKEQELLLREKAIEYFKNI